MRGAGWDRMMDKTVQDLVVPGGTWSFILSSVENCWMGYNYPTSSPLTAHARLVTCNGHWVHLPHSLLQWHLLMAVSISWVLSRYLAGVMPPSLGGALSGSICLRVSREEAGSYGAIASCCPPAPHLSSEGRFSIVHGNLDSWLQFCS